MNKQIYQTARRSIRDNGLHYTARHAADVGDTDTMFVCDDVANLMRETDWLAMRAQFARSEKPAIAIKLTCSEWLLRRDMQKPIVWGA